MISRNIKINILQDAGIQKLFFPGSSTPLWVLDAEMDMGTVLIIRSSSRTHSGPLEVLPGLEHSGTSKKTPRARGAVPRQPSRVLLEGGNTEP